MSIRSSPYLRNTRESASRSALLSSITAPTDSCFTPCSIPFPPLSDRELLADVCLGPLGPCVLSAEALRRLPHLAPYCRRQRVEAFTARRCLPLATSALC